ncbi:MAG: hypothetical protein LAO77_12840 [Acidobacteriia bacterium]|nr:hypothetical protein [Terriglobia bacterium]
MTVLAFWQQQLTTYQAAQSAAQSDLSAAQAALAAAKTKLDTDQRALAATLASIASARAALAVATIPADAAALIETITQSIITQRAQQGTVLDDQDAVAEAQASADAAAATLARAASRIASVTSTIAAVTADDDRRQAYKTAIAAAPFNTLKADATTYLASATVTNATTRIGVDFPDKILTIAGKRHDARTGRVDSLHTVVENAEDALANERDTNGGLAGAAASALTEFARAEAAVADYVATASVKFTRAQTIMAALAAIQLDSTLPDVLTDAEKTQVAALKAAAAAAEPTAETLDGDLTDIFDAEDDLAAQVLTSIAANVDGLASDATITAKKAAITSAKNAFAAALATFNGANKDDLDALEAVIPDTAWLVLLEYEEGMAALNEIAGITPATLASAMDAAESTYAAALAAAALSDRRVDALSDAIAYQQDRLDAARAAIAARLPSAIRGDSY